MPKARGTKAKYRIDAIHELEDVAGQRIGDDRISIKIHAPRQGKKILIMDGVSKSFDGQPLIHKFSYTVKRKERVGIVGSNGTGKTTLLRLITGELEPDEGEVIRGETTRIGYYKQDEIFFRPEQRVIDIVKEVAEVVQLSDGHTITAAQFLQNFLFAPEVHHVAVEKLSGGEKRRLQLLRVLMEKPNFLILDEPTNDLDIYTLNVLEDYLSQFDGSLIIVSHDRYFMDKLADHLFVFESDAVIRDFPGNYADYRNQLQQERNRAPKRERKPSKEQTRPRSSSNRKRRRNYREEQEYQLLEKEIEKLESLKNELIAKMNSGTSDHEALNQWSNEFESISNEIEEKTARWIELSEYDD
jgi:ATP-binding cassette subfamily F protein uup